MPYKLYQVNYKDERMIPDIYRLVSKDLSEPYSIFTYRYFLHNFPHLCICYYAVEDPNATGNEDIEESEIIPEGSTMVATIVSSISEGKTGYIAMLAVDQTFRNRGLGSKLVKANIDRIIADGCNEIILETEASNTGALSLYKKIGFVCEDKMMRYYLNGGDAYRLKLSV